MSAVLDFLRQYGSTRSVKASAIAAGIQALTGSAPQVRNAQDDYGAYTEITPTEAQVPILRKQLEAWLDSEPGDVRLNLSGIWWPVVLKRLGLWASGALGLAYFLGRKS